MILTKIELNNFGSYRNRNTFEINTNDSSKKIVIIGGKNGAGKTTLFTAIELALYGHYCFGYKNAGKLYTRKVMTYINDQAKLNDNETAYVSLDFSDSSNGDLDHFSVTRRWIWKRGEIKESFSATKNGKQLRNRDLVDFQNFLLHLIPPALLKLCFFDGERIAEYLLDDQKNNVRDALMVLSGNDTFDIMHGSVRKVFSASQSEEDSVTREYLRCKSTLEKIFKRSGVAGVKRSLSAYAFDHLCQILGIIDEEEFETALISYESSDFELLMEINKDTLSKGETQVFVMSLYWAMMQQCKCELPFIIDTPFARIDTDHRTNIVEQFFKKLPGQLFVLSTNEEISSTHMAALSEQTSNVFLLEYGDDKCTHIIENRYFEV